MHTFIISTQVGWAAICPLLGVFTDALAEDFFVVAAVMMRGKGECCVRQVEVVGSEGQVRSWVESWQVRVEMQLRTPEPRGQTPLD